MEWPGWGLAEQGIDLKPGKVLVMIHSRYFRPTEVETLLGDCSRAKARLGWSPEISFDSLVKEMVQADLDLAQRDSHMQKHGFRCSSTMNEAARIYVAGHRGLNDAVCTGQL